MSPLSGDGPHPTATAQNNAFFSFTSQSLKYWQLHLKPLELPVEVFSKFCIISTCVLGALWVQK